MQRIDVLPIPGLSEDLGLLIATWQDGTREWRGELGEPTQEALVWQMYPNGPSIGGLVMHMASCDLGWLRKFVDGEALDENDPACAYGKELDVDAGQWPTPPNEPWEWYVGVLETARAQAIERIRAHADPMSLHVGGEYELTYRWIIAHLVEHDSYHGGQAVLLHEAWKRLKG